jgi:predicted pyridoxine 5'-phosphate oxidase superfamily flavin-nucleotide-binding protein
MTHIPDIVRAAWTNREGYALLTTVDTAGMPNAVYVGSFQLQGDDTVVIADNYFAKTRANIFAGSRGSFVFLTKERRSYQLKGRFEYLTEGPVFDEMKCWNPTRHPGVAAAALRVDEVYSGAERLA